MEAASEWCNWLFQASVLTLAVPSSLRLMMSKSKSLLRPSVLLRTMCPVSPSHCAYREEIQRKREVGDSLKCLLSSLYAQSLIEALEKTPRRKSEGDWGSEKLVLTDGWKTHWIMSDELVSKTSTGYRLLCGTVSICMNVYVHVWDKNYRPVVTTQIKVLITC